MNFSNRSTFDRKQVRLLILIFQQFNFHYCIHNIWNVLSINLYLTIWNYNKLQNSTITFHKTKTSFSFTEVDTIKCEKNYEICEGCGQKIHDRYLMRVADASWHEQCLSCCVCGVPLNHSCYVRNTKLYCKTDYDRWVYRAFLLGKIHNIKGLYFPLLEDSWDD